MRISSRAKSEFLFYQGLELDMIGHIVGCKSVQYDEKGASALEAWWSIDTHGKEIPCREIELLEKVIRSKQSINLQIKLWAEDIADGLILRQSELIEYTHNWPNWVIRATMEQAKKLTKERLGFSPRFARLEFLFKNIWLPEMDRFDPVI